MKKDEAIILKINRDNPELIYLVGSKVYKTIVSEMPYDELEKNITAYIKFY